MSTPAEDLALAEGAGHTRRGQPLTSPGPTTTPEAVGTGAQAGESGTRNGRSCVCPAHADAEQCIDLRYNGHSPGPNSAKPCELRDECQCVCHADAAAEDDES